MERSQEYEDKLLEEFEGSWKDLAGNAEGGKDSTDFPTPASFRYRLQTSFSLWYLLWPVCMSDFFWNLQNRNKTQSFLNSKVKIQKFSFKLQHRRKPFSESPGLPSLNDSWAFREISLIFFFIVSNTCLNVNRPLLLSYVRFLAQCETWNNFKSHVLALGLIFYPFEVVAEIL